MGPNLLTVIILVLFVRQYACQCMNGKNCFYTFDAAYSWGANNYGANGDGVPQQQEYAVLVNTTNIPGPISKISSKVDHAIIISNGKIYAWGKNEFGQIGDGSQISRYLPVLVRMEFEIIDIATGSFHSVALARNGRVYTWGNGINGNLGNRKNISLVPSPVDTSGVLRGKNITSITSGSEYTVVLSDTGQLYAWGAGNEGQLGNGYQYGRLTPVQVNMTGFQNEIVVMVSAGWSHTIALTSSGRVYTWGRGADGQLGVGCCGNVLSPIAVNLQIPIVSIGTGFYHTFAIANNGVIFAWGDNRSGQLGDGTTNIRVRPTVVYMQGIASGSTVQKITGGQLHSVAITNDGRIYAWGDNSLGQLGDGSTLSRYIPIPVFDAKTTITSMTAAQFSTFCLSKNGTAYSWGSNNAGQLGNGIIPFRVLPVTVKMPQGITVQSISCGAFHTIALLNNGQMYAWGQNTYGQLGDGSTVNRYIPVPVDINVSQVREYKFAAIAAGIEHSVALTEEGEVFTWGRGWAGQLGEGTTNDRLRPTQIVQSYGMFFGELVKSIAAGGSNTAALTDKGRVYIWGSNQYGQLCNGAQTNGLLPTQVKQLLNHYVIAISVGDSFVLALTKEGTIFSWGANNCGQLGIGTIVASAIPVMVQLPVDIKAAKIAAGGYHALMLTNTGQLYAWGYGSYGQLGIGSAATELNPVALNMTRFRYSVTGIAAGRSHSMAILQDGGIYAWGAGDVGQLGYGETTDQFLPIQVSMKQYPSAKKAIAISASNAASFALFIRCSNGFVGDYCDIPVCFGENATDTDIVCNGRGNCTAPDKCTCYPNSLYEGLNCEYPICFGSSLFKNNTTPLCSNNGKCIGPDLCECTSKLFFGKECEQSVLVWIAIALVVTIIGLVILFMPILLFCVYYRRRLVKQRQVEMEMQSLLNQSLLDSSSSSSTNSEEREEREWIIRIEDLTFSERISEGSFGVVFKGLYRNSPVAIKIIKNSSNDESFHHEVRVLKSLRHPNIVLFMGVCLKDDNKFIVTELMMGKSLEHLLYQATSRLTADASPFNLHRNITFTHKIHLLLDVVKGMIYLHNLEPPLLHRDLKPSNILLDKSHTTAKVCDFGAAKFMISENTNTGNIGTLFYMSPELLLKDISVYNEKCDVYSFGIIMYEVFFELRPYATNSTCESMDFGNLFSIGYRVVEGMRPKYPKSINRPFTEQEQAYLTLMEQCWDANPNVRPSFTEIYSRFEKFASLIS